MHAEEHDGGLRQLSGNLPGGFDAVENRHRHVDHHHVGLMLLGQRHGLAAIRGVARAPSFAAAQWGIIVYAIETSPCKPLKSESGNFGRTCPAIWNRGRPSPSRDMPRPSASMFRP